MRLTLVVIVTMIWLHSPTWAQEKAVLSGQQLKACMIALTLYDRFSNKADPEHHTVVVTDLQEGIEVAFIPYGPNDEITTMGGTSPYGEGIQYLVSRDTFEVLSVTFSR